MAESVQVNCTKCGKTFAIGSEVDEDARVDWICPEHGGDRITLEVIDFIKDRIHVARTEYENQGRMVLRELVQNADDAKATILVLRFDADALYVANDGRAFTTHPEKAGKKSDFERIRRILQRHKEAEVEATGHFGSGFQTVYTFTNAPEIHSGGWSLRMDPVRGKVTYMDFGSPEHLVSPYVWRPPEEPRGALFRFPWRDDEAAEQENAEGNQSFKDPNDFPRWNPPDCKALFDDLATYIRHVILCCNNLQTVRLIWNCEGEVRCVQARRTDVREGQAEGNYVRSVSVGNLEASSEWIAWDNRSDADQSRSWESFQPAGRRAFQWQKGLRQEYRYLARSGHVVDDGGNELHIGRHKESGYIFITQHLKDLSGIVKKNDVSILFPLFDANLGEEGQGKAFLYSVIPLPKRGENWFAFNGRFFPEQSRLDVAVASFGGKAGKWHERIVVSVGRLFVELLPEFVRQVKSANERSLDKAQRILLNVIPGVELYRWMRSKEDEPAWAANQWTEIIRSIIQQAILLNDGGWYSLSDAYWSGVGQERVDAKGRQVLEVLGAAYFTDSLVTHPHFKKILAEHLSKQGLTTEVLTALFETFLRRNGGKLTYKSTKSTTGTLGRKETQALLDYCVISRDAAAVTRRLPVVPGLDCILRPLSDYKILAGELASLGSLLPDKRRIHPDFEDALSSIDSDERIVRPDEVPPLIADIARSRPEWAEELPRKDVEVVSQALGVLASNPQFSLKDVFADMSFIPYKQKGKTKLGPPNSIRDRDALKVYLLQRDRRESYRREFIYSPTKERPEWLTDELGAAVKVIDIQGVNEATRKAIFTSLNLIPLQEGKLPPTTFVRAFLSGEQGSLFEDKRLSAFLGVAKGEFSRQKKAFLHALRVYFRPRESKDQHTEAGLTPEDMGRIPCLYDAKGEWAPCSEFVLGMRLELQVLGYRELNRDFKSEETWPEKTLLSLGAVDHPEAKRIIATVRDLQGRPETHRAELANIFVYLVSVPHDWETELAELRKIRWVPTCDGGFKEPGKVIASTRDNIAILGDKHPSLFDYRACSSSFLGYLEGGKGKTATPEKYRQLGVSPEPCLDTMVDLVRTLAAEGRAPPKNLLHALSKVLGESPTSIKGSYWFDGKWYTGDKVILQHDDLLRESLGVSYLVVERRLVSGESSYLDAIGAKERPGVEDLVYAIGNLSSSNDPGKSEIEALQSLWNKLEDAIILSKQAGLKLPEAQSRSTRYPVDDTAVPIGHVLLPPEDGEPNPFKREGWYGSWYAFTNTNRCQHARALRYLGSRIPKRLQPQDVQELLESLSAKKGSLDDAERSAAVSLLEGVQEVSPKYQFGTAAIWPVVRGEEYKLAGMSDAFLADHPAYEQFASDIWAFYPVDGSGVQRLRNLLLVQKPPCASLRATLGKEVILPRKQFPDRYVADRLHLMAEALSRLVRDEKKSLPLSFEWMKSAQAFRADGLKVRLTVSRVTKTISVPSEIVEERGKTMVYLLTVDPGLSSNLAEHILVESLRQNGRHTGNGFADIEESQRAHLLKSIRDLLDGDPADWHRLVPGLREITDYVPPLIPNGVENKPGYPETRAKLMEWYDGCQICGRKTPASEDGQDTCETLRSVISRRGGKYYGEFDHYEVGNSLFLCPNHQTLFERKLVRFTEMNPAVEDGRPIPKEAPKAAKILKDYANGWTAEQWKIEVLEAEKEEEYDLGWRPRKMHLKKEHARELFSRLASWLESAV